MHQSVILADMRRMTALVTGRTAGIGHEVAHAIAAHRARVLSLSRPVENGDRTFADIRRAVYDLACARLVHCGPGNLDNFRGVEIRGGQKRRGIIVPDSGIGMSKLDLSFDGFDRHLEVDLLARFLLTNRLLPLMRQTSDLANTPYSHIVSILSDMHRMASSSIPLAAMEVMEIGSQDLSAASLYARMKLGDIFTEDMPVKRVLQPSAARTLALVTHPDVVRTGQQDQYLYPYGSLEGSFAEAATVPFACSDHAAPGCTLWPAIEETNGRHGHYFTDPSQLGKEMTMICDGRLGKNLHGLNEALIFKRLGKDALFS